MNGVSVIHQICVGSKIDNREKILEYERFAKENVQVEIPPTHYIHGGMYAREITIPKGTIITGQIYKFNHLDIMISGDITVTTDTDKPVRYKGYNLFKGMSGKKRAGYAHEDTVWITIHPVTGADGEEIQSLITAQTFEELEIFNAELSKIDFAMMIDGMQIDEKTMCEQSNNESDYEEISADFVMLGNSKIHGKGLFAKSNFCEGDLIMPARVDSKRTQAGRYTNHSANPNARMVVNDSGVYLVAIRSIFCGDEITVNYRDVLSERLSKGDICQE